MTNLQPVPPAAVRYWAFRTTRETPAVREFILEEIRNGRLRQGWAYDACQDLRVIAARWTASGWAPAPDASTAQLQSEAWKNLPMLGDSAPEGVTARMRIGDIVLLPNVPRNGAFSLCRVTGDYAWSPSADPRSQPYGRPDFASTLPVELIAEGIDAASEIVPEALRASLRPASRFWSLNHRKEAIDAILGGIAEKSEALHRRKPGPVLRAQDAISGLLDEIRPKAVARLRADLRNTDWEHVLGSALEALVSPPEVIHTGGRNEQGRDLEIACDVPLLPEPLIVAVQVKDWSGVAGPQVMTQLREIVERYRPASGPRRATGFLSGIVLAVTDAEASPALQTACEQLEIAERIPVRYVGRDDLMEVVLRGLLRKATT